MDDNNKLNNYVKELNNLYRSNPELHELDYDPDGFEWINNFLLMRQLLYSAVSHLKADILLRRSILHLL